MKSMNTMLVGVGLHSKRIYIPSIDHFSKNYPVKLAAIVELKSARDSTKYYLQQKSIKCREIYVDTLDGSGELPFDVKNMLDSVRDSEKINSVIIATDPTNHLAYANWALRNNLNIIMDKPISTYPNVANDPKIAEKFVKDFDKLIALYEGKLNCFIVNAQRRYHPGFKIIRAKIDEISDRYKIPITSMQSSHSDGQWRLPEEIISLSYHSYNHGYGKVSHSGYHLIDVCADLINRSYLKSGKYFDRRDVYAKFIKPDALIKQQSRADYERIFGKEDYARVSSLSDKELKEAYKDYGEVDASALITYENEGIGITSLSMSLTHNSFTRRSWMNPAIEDLYKSNGRVKHEYHNIQQGPFQNIQVHSYQKEDKQEESNELDWLLGGNNHFDILIFRNNGLTGELETLEKITMKDLYKDRKDLKTGLLSDSSKYDAIEEFIKFSTGLIDKRELSSDLSTHRDAVTLMGQIYLSASAEGGSTHLFDTGTGESS